jgi:hypothetical protein
MSLAVTTGSANCSIFSVSTHYGASGATADTNYTAAFADTAVSSGYHFGQYRVNVGAAGLQTVTHNLTSPTQVWTAAMVAYKTETAGPGSAALSGGASTADSGTAAPGISIGL